MARTLFRTTRSTPRLIATVLGSAMLMACSDQPVAPTVLPEALTVPSGAQRILANSSGTPEQADVLNQGGAGVYAPGGAMVVRQPNGLRLSVTMPTPAPGTYVYAPGRTDVGHPEVFTLWAFVFNYPENCTGPCDGDDLGAGTAAKGAVYNVAGHPGSGSSLTLAGHIRVGEAPFAPIFASLESPGTAEIHLAVAPHGALDASRLPGDFRMPTGSPACGCWWVAVLD
jgi:hypothetical protein